MTMRTSKIWPLYWDTLQLNSYERVFYCFAFKAHWVRYYCSCAFFSHSVWLLFPLSLPFEFKFSLSLFLSNLNKASISLELKQNLPSHTRIEMKSHWNDRKKNSHTTWIGNEIFFPNNNTVKPFDYAFIILLSNV